MSSWVAPSVAAELWGISVDQVLAGIADGSIPSYVDGQFLFVDVRGQGVAATSSRIRVDRKRGHRRGIRRPHVSTARVRVKYPNPTVSRRTSRKKRTLATWAHGAPPEQQSARTRRPPQANAA